MKKFKKFSPLLFAFLLSNCAILHNEPYYNGNESDHFDGKKFVSQNDENFFDHIRFLFTIKSSWGDAADEIKRPQLNEFNPLDRARVTFIGHSTFLIQIPDVNILTDPIWSDFAGPIPLPVASPKRKNPPPLDLEDLPKIDYVLISYNSYYHMDLPTIKKLKKKFNPTFVTGLGNCYYLNNIKKLGLQCVELDWDQKVKLQNGTDFYFVKSQNWSQRSWFDENKTLWGSFLIITPNFKIYFAGDSGYSPHLREINAKYGNFDLALLPIGSYEPRWFTKYSHMNPEDAVKAHIVLNAKKSIGMHFNTFQTTNEDYYDAKISLEEAKKTYGLRGQEFVAPKFGETFEF